MQSPQVNVLDKTRLDWQALKKGDAGLEEELEEHKRSNRTYLERVRGLESWGRGGRGGPGGGGGAVVFLSPRLRCRPPACGWRRCYRCGCVVLLGAAPGGRIQRAPRRVLRRPAPPLSPPLLFRRRQVDFLQRSELREYEKERDQRLASDVRTRGRL